MPKIVFKSSKDLVKEWPEVFSDLYINTMPVNYLDFIQIEFKTGMVWKVEIQDQIDIHGPENVAKFLEQTLSEYSSEVEKFDFKLNIKKLKTDVAQSTKSIL